MERRTALRLLSLRSVGLLTALATACTTSDASYEETVRAHVRQGPGVACCEVEGRPRDARCETEATARCAFVTIDASVRATRVARFGHDDGATVDVTISSGHGRGECTYQVLNFPRGHLHVQGGTCFPR